MSWWHTNPVSRCKGEKCGQQRYDALPRWLEFGIGRCVCPNEDCEFEFFVRCEASRIFKCRKCKTECKPDVHPNWEKKRKIKHASFHSISPARVVIPCPPCPPCPPGVTSNIQTDYSKLLTPDNISIGPRSSVSLSTAAPFHQHMRMYRRKNRCKNRRKKLVFNASEIHEPTSGFVSTSLTQIDFERTTEEVDLEYNSSDNSDDDSSNDDGDEKVGEAKMIPHLECLTDSQSESITS